VREKSKTSKGHKAPLRPHIGTFWKLLNMIWSFEDSLEKEIELISD
jgi:hypothetical protein